MRCLQCGSQLALLKKFTDGEFCSAEHRTLFYDTQQKLIIERLAASALRFKRHKKNSKSAPPAHLQPVPVAPKEKLPPFAPILPEIVLDTLYIRNPLFTAQRPIPAIGVQLVLNTPKLRNFTKRARVNLAQPVYGYVFAREWTRPRISLRILDAASQLRPTLPSMPELRVATGVRSLSQPNPLFAPTNPTSSSRQVDSTVSASSAGPLFGANLTHALPGFEQSSLAIKGLNSLRTPFRMRPRGPVQDAAVAVFQEIKANLIEVPATAPYVLPVLLVAQNHAEAPLACTRFFRPKPRGPVSSASIFETERIEAPAGPFTRALSTPSLLPSNLGEHSPVFLDRALSPAPQQPLQADGVSHAYAISEETFETLSSQPVPPTLLPTVVGTCSPNSTRRFFRMGPKGPATSDSLAAFESIDNGTIEELLSSPAPATLPQAIIGEFHPVRVDSFSSVRTRGPVQASSLEASEEISVGSSLSVPARPATATLPASLVGECSPSPVVRFFSPRPRGPVQSPAISGFEQIAAGTPPELLSKPVIGTLPSSVIGECSPATLVRFFKARPRVPVAPDAAAMEASSGDSLPLFSKPVAAALSLDLAGDCTPKPLLRFFKPRPRGPVQADTLTAFERIPGGTPLNLLRPATATMSVDVIGECSPNPVAGFFNVGPRRAVTTNGSGMEAIFGDSLSLVSPPVIAALSANVIAECVPNAVVRFFKARPRGPVQGQVKLLMSDPGAGASLRAQLTPVRCALPVSIIGELAPTLRDKPYRMKPRGPVQASDLATFQAVHAGSAADVSRKGLAPQLLLGEGLEFAPTFLNRFYKMRPRGPMQAHSVAFEPLQAGSPETLQSKASMPSMPAVLMRQARKTSKDRPSRMDPPGPRPSAGSTTHKHIDEGETETRVPQASMSALPDSVLADCAPRGLNRFFRTRPRGASADRNVPGFEQIPTGSTFDAVGALEMAGPQLNPALAGQLATDPLCADVIFALVSADYCAPVQPAASQHEFTPMQAKASMPAFVSDLIVDYRPSLIEIRGALRETHKPGFLGRIAEFWNESTWEMKWAAAAVPVLLGVFVHSTITRPVLPGMHNMDKAAIASNPLPPLQRAVTDNLGELRHQMIGRSGIDLQDNFTAGLGAWNGEKGWNRTWTQDAHGGVKPGALALFTPSTRLRDYVLEFTGEIEKNGFGWVYRAADTQNYYAVKLVTLSSGPMPTVAVERYTVVGGKQGPTTRKILPYPVTSNTVYRVAMTVEGQFFTLFVQGQVVDFWSDNRLQTGGIGFFNGKGEESRLESVRVVHQLDALGRIYASLSLNEQTASQSGVGIHEPKK